MSPLNSFPFQVDLWRLSCVVTLTILVTSTSAGNAVGQERPGIEEAIKHALVNWVDKQGVGNRISLAGNVEIKNGNSERLFKGADQGFIDDLLKKMVSESLSDTKIGNTNQKLLVVDDLEAAEIRVDEVVILHSDDPTREIEGKIRVSYRTAGTDNRFRPLRKLLSFEIPIANASQKQQLDVLPTVAIERSAELSQLLVESPSDRRAQETDARRSQRSFQVSLIAIGENESREEVALARDSERADLLLAHGFEAEQAFEIKLTNPYAFDAAALVRINRLPRATEGDRVILDMVPRADVDRDGMRIIRGWGVADEQNFKNRFVLAKSSDARTPGTTVGHHLSIEFHFASNEQEKLKAFVREPIALERGFEIKRGSKIIDLVERESMYVSDVVQTMHVVFVE